jgi:hypothetical protein
MAPARKPGDSPGQPPLGPPVSVAYLVVQGGPNLRLFDEFLFSFASLRRHHPHLPVFVHHEDLQPGALRALGELPGVLPMRIAARQEAARFERNDYDRRYGWQFPELEILAAKIDVLLLTPGHTLLLDTDTEVLAPLDEVLRERRRPWMHDDEGLLAAQDGRDFSSVLGPRVWQAFGWRGDLARLRMLNSGAVFVPQHLKPALYQAKEYLWAMAGVPGHLRGDNRLDEQVALSVALQEAVPDYDVRTMPHLVDHYWREKYETLAPRTPRICEPLADGSDIVVPSSYFEELRRTAASATPALTATGT